MDISFRLNIQYEPSKLGPAVIERLRNYSWFPGDDDKLNAHIAEMVSDGRVARDFVKWCRDQERRVDPKYAELLFQTLSLATYSEHQRDQLIRVKDDLTYWQLSSMTRFCESHAQLDLLTRKWDDPVWADIYPPNGWVCGCSVLACLPEDAEDAPILDVSDSLREQCRNWLRSDPSSAISLL